MPNQQYSAQLPARDTKAGNDDGTLTGTWYDYMVFLASLTASEFEQQDRVELGLYAFQASKIGHLHVETSVATTSVVLQRGGVSLTCPTSGFIPVVAGDEVTVMYDSSLGSPVVTFMPGART